MAVDRCPICEERMGREIVTITRRYFRNCGDHDEGVTVLTVAVCSMPCASKAASDVEKGEAEIDARHFAEERF